MLSNSLPVGSDGVCGGTADSCPGVRPNCGHSMSPSIHTSPFFVETSCSSTPAVNAIGERICPKRSKISPNIGIGAYCAARPPLAISSYAHRTPLERSYAEGVHGLHSNPERHFPKRPICEAFIEGSSVAESSWTTSPLEAAADEGREAYGSPVFGSLFR